MSSDNEIMESLAEACSLNNLPSYLRSTYCPWCKCSKALGLDGNKIMTDKLQRHITEELSKELKRHITDEILKEGKDE